MSFLQQLRTTLVFLVLFTILFGVVYPLLGTVFASSLFQDKASGSLLRGKDGAVYGSELIGQNFTNPQYFWGRLSATGPVPYNAASSSGSNLGSNNPALLENAEARIDALHGEQPVPVDLVTASASGLDPHISPEAAAYQVARVAQARGLSEQEVESYVTKATEGRQFGILGEPRVNVLKLNLMLDGKL